VLWYLSVILEIMASLTHLLGRIFPQSVHIFLQTSHFPHPSEKAFEQTKEIIFDCILANITGPLVRGLCCPSQKLMKKALHEITVVKAILILFLLLFAS